MSCPAETADVSEVFREGLVRPNPLRCTRSPSREFSSCRSRGSAVPHVTLLATFLGDARKTSSQRADIGCACCLPPLLCPFTLLTSRISCLLFYLIAKYRSSVVLVRALSTACELTPRAASSYNRPIAPCRITGTPLGRVRNLIMPTEIQWEEKQAVAPKTVDEASPRSGSLFISR